MGEVKNGKTVKLTCGAFSKSFEIAGQTVGQVRKAYQQQASIPKDATARVNGQDAKDTLVLKAGDRLEFVKPSGKKGN